MSDRSLPRLNFQRQLILMALLPLALLTLLVLVLFYFAINNVTRDLVLQRNQSLVNLAAASIAHDVQGQLAPLQASAAALAALSGDPIGQQERLDRDAPFLQSFDGGVTLLDLSGKAIASSADSRDRLGLDYSFRGYFQAVLRDPQPAYSTALQEQPTGRLAVTIAVPIRQGGDPRGVLVGVLFLREHPWPGEIEILQSQSGRIAMLVDSQGAILYHPDPARIGRDLGDPSLSALAHAGQNRSLLYRRAEDGQEWIAAYAPLNPLGWGMLVEEPFTPLLDPALPYFYWVAAALLAGFLAATLILVHRLRGLMQPVVELMDAARSVSVGEPFTPVRERGPAETRLLASIFNQMVERLEEQQKTVRQYAHQMIESQEEERRRISRDLHDETVQDLVGLSQRLELCRNALVRDPAAARLRLDELQALTNRALTDVRRMSNDLRPTVLEDFGLLVAVHRLCEGLEEDLPTIQVEFSVTGHERRLTPEVELVTYRVVQETLTNIRKHARSATRTEVKLFFGENELNASVADDGPGFEYTGVADLIHQGHLGLAGMVERTSLMQGKLTILSRPGQGVKLELCLPV